MRRVRLTAVKADFRGQIDRAGCSKRTDGGGGGGRVKGWDEKIAWVVGPCGKLTGHDICLLIVGGQQLQVESLESILVVRGDGNQDVAALVVRGLVQGHA